jgi:Uma2 family endonuclease
MKEIPQIALEVVVSSGLVDKLDVYSGLGVPEVWVFERGALTVYLLTEEGYRAHPSSEVLPALDITQLASFVRIDVMQSAAVREYRAALRA